MNSLDLIDRGAGVFHGHQQPSRVQYSVMMGALEGQQPRVATVVRHIHIRGENRFRVSNTSWRLKQEQLDSFNGTLGNTRKLAIFFFFTMSQNETHGVGL